MNKDFKISSKEYFFYVRYLNLIENQKLLNTANIKLENYLNNNSVKYTDFFLNSCIRHYFDIFFLDFLSKFFFQRSIIRLKLNIVLALQEAEYDNFNHMINNTNFKLVMLDMLRYIIVSITFPLWLLYKFSIFKLILEKKDVYFKK